MLLDLRSLYESATGAITGTGTITISAPGLLGTGTVGLTAAVSGRRRTVVMPAAIDGRGAIAISGPGLLGFGTVDNLAQARREDEAMMFGLDDAEFSEVLL